MNVDILDPQLLAIFQLDELLENVLNQMDNKSLLKFRSVSSNWNQEINKILVKRRYGRIILLQKEGHQLQEIFISLKNGGFINPRILIGNVSISFGLYNLFNAFLCPPHHKMLLTNYGFLIHNLQFFCYLRGQLEEMRRNRLNVIDVLNECPNIETLAFLFAFDSHSNDALISDPFSINEHKKLKTLHLCNVDSGFNNTLNTLNGYAKLLPQIKFYLDLIKQVILSTQQLKNLCINDRNVLTDFWKMLTEDQSGVPGKLRHIQQLHLLNYSEWNQPEIEKAAFFKLLQIISNSAEILSFSNNKANSYFSLPAYFTMEKLTTLFVEIDPVRINCIELKRESLPSLNTIVIGEYKGPRNSSSGFYNYDWTFKWPFCATLGTWDRRYQWEESTKGLTVSKPREGDSNTSDSQLNVVIYLVESTFPLERKYKYRYNFHESWVETIVNGISKMPVGSLFINLQHPDYESSIEHWKTFFLAKLAKMPYLKHCLIHDNRSAGGENPHPRTYQLIKKDWNFVEMA